MELPEEQPKKGTAGIALIALILWTSMLVFTLLYFDGAWQIAFFANLAFCMIVAVIAIKRKLTFGWALLISVLLSPILGLIFTLVSRRVDDVVDNGTTVPEFTSQQLARQQTFTRPAYAVPTKPAPLNNVADELRKLNELRKEGVLTDEEFDAQKIKLLSS